MNESLDWLFPAESELPLGLRVEVLAAEGEELGTTRLEAPVKILGREKALRLAHHLGSYELGEELARQLELDGVVLGEEGEVPALSPSNWARTPQAEKLSDFRARIEKNKGEIRGLLLDSAQRSSFLQFLGANAKIPDADSWNMVELARHFFFNETLNVVVRYTGPRFHHS